MQVADGLTFASVGLRILGSATSSQRISLGLGRTVASMFSTFDESGRDFNAQRIAATAKRPLMEIACPVWPSVARSPSAIGVSRLTGMNSEAISIATHSAIERTAPQAAAGLPSVSVAAAATILACSCMKLLQCKPNGRTRNDNPMKSE
ncbi:MAG: hypothetical protein ACOY5F_18595 [Pseudomonadota bacterium]